MSHQTMISPAELFDEAHALKCDLAAEVLRSSGQLRLRVRGSSMLPAVWPGDVLLIGRIEAKAVALGDLVLYARDRRFFVHRVIGRIGDSTISDSMISESTTGEATTGESTLGESKTLTRGDAMPQPDLPVLAADILGRVAFLVRDGKLIEPKKSLSLPQQAAAALIRRSGIAMRVAIGFHGIWQNLRRRNLNHRVVPCQS
jgi:signal peptidase I